jgi:hypothetical protein
MAVVSIRFSDSPVHGRLKEHARHRRVGISTLAERLIDEGLRMESHPLVIFREGPSGRRAVLVAGPEVVDVIGSIVGGDVLVEQRRSRAADLLEISESAVDAALSYYADFTQEVDDEIGGRIRAADEAEAAWRRQQDLLQK